MKKVIIATYGIKKTSWLPWIGRTIQQTAIIKTTDKELISKGVNLILREKIKTDKADFVIVDPLNYTRVISAEPLSNTRVSDV